jgi:hypothetical protein
MKTYFLNTFLLLFLLFGCSTNLIENPSTNNISINVRFLNKPFPYPNNNASTPNKNQKLKKPKEIINTRVLSLTGDGSDPAHEKDSSPYQNHAFLMNVNRTKSESRATLSFSGENSYCRVNHSNELNGDKGFLLKADVILNNSSQDFQTIISKTGTAGGYILGVQNENFYLIIKRTDRDFVLNGTMQILPSQIYNVEAGFDSDKLFININGELDASIDYNGPVPSNLGALFIGASQIGVGLSDYLYGELDNIIIFTKIDFVDIDAIRVAIMDLSNFVSMDSLWTIKKYIDFDSTRHHAIYSTREITWTGLTSLLGSYFPIVSNQNLPVSNGFAEGTIVGSKGLNLVSIAAIRGEAVQYYGEGFVVAQNDQDAELFVNLYKVQ